MRAVTYQGKKKIKVKEAADPGLEKKDDILVRVTSTAICGSDLHIYNGNIPGKMGQAPVIHYIPALYQMIKDNIFDPTDIITHKLPIEDAEHAYGVFSEKEENCIKEVLKP